MATKKNQLPTDILLMQQHNKLLEKLVKNQEKQLNASPTKEELVWLNAYNQEPLMESLRKCYADKCLKDFKLTFKD